MITLFKKTPLKWSLLGAAAILAIALLALTIPREGAKKADSSKPAATLAENTSTGTLAKTNVTSPDEVGPYSPDKLWMAYFPTNKDEDGPQGLVIKNLETGRTWQATREVPPYGSLLWGPDNILYYPIEDAEHPDIIWYAADPAKMEAKPFLPQFLSGQRASIRSFSPDGREVLFATNVSFSNVPRNEDQVRNWTVGLNGRGLHYLGQGPGAMQGFTWPVVQTHNDNDGIMFGLTIDETVQHGEVWAEAANLPQEALQSWFIGLTDSTGRNFVLGRPQSGGKTVTYPLPEGVSPGEGSVWLSAGADSSRPGMLKATVNVLKAYDTYESKELGVRFKVPRAWRLNNYENMIFQQRLDQRPVQPAQDIYLAHYNPQSFPDHAEKEKTIEIEVNGKPATQTWFNAHSANKTAFWREIHTVVAGRDIVLQYRPGFSSFVTDQEAWDAYDLILKTLVLEK